MAHLRRQWAHLLYAKHREDGSSRAKGLQVGCIGNYSRNGLLLLLLLLLLLSC